MCFYQDFQPVLSWHEVMHSPLADHIHLLYALQILGYFSFFPLRLSTPMPSPTPDTCQTGPKSTPHLLSVVHVPQLALGTLTQLLPIQILGVQAESKAAPSLSAHLLAYRPSLIIFDFLDSMSNTSFLCFSNQR